MKLYSYLLLLVIITSCSTGTSQSWKDLAPPVVGNVWVQPVQGEPAQPIWGHADGLRIGLAPMPGPRGLLRVYTPYLGHKEGKMINFIALEPIPEGSEHRGLSELEMSSLDNKHGKRFWSADDSQSTEQRAENLPAKGVISEIGGVQTLTVFVFSEPFENGTKVYIRLRFYEDKPYEVEIATFATDDSKPLKNFIITATMGNYARLRTLHLADTTVSSLDLWPEYRDSNFAPHAHFPVDDFITDEGGNAYFIAAPDEEHPQTAQYADDTNDHWKYYGDLATQYWYVENPKSDLEGLVNGRFAYWGSKSPIPGGISFENFELKAPFSNGAEFVFGVDPAMPEEFIKNLKEKK
ncbi:MAG: hypothetical protein WD555_01835 [Fulvivirga sp.]